MSDESLENQAGIRNYINQVTDLTFLFKYLMKLYYIHSSFCIGLF